MNLFRRMNRHYKMKLTNIQFKLTYVSQIHVITEVVVEDTDIDDSGATAFQDTMEDCAKYCKLNVNRTLV